MSSIMAALHKWYTSIVSRHLFSLSGFLVDEVTTYIFLYCWVALSWACVATVWTHTGYFSDILYRFWHSLRRSTRLRLVWSEVVSWALRGIRKAREDHIVTTEPIEPHMDYHAPYMTWYRYFTHRFITLMDDFGPMRYQTTVLSTHLLVYISLILCTYFV